MHRHGTMRGRWKALAFGMVWVALGVALAWLGLGPVFAADVPQPPSFLQGVAILAGAAFVVLGAVLGITPHVIWLLRTMYKEDFAPGATCPIMLVCPSCAAYNPRGRVRCKACRGDMVGARAAGGNEGSGARAAA